MARILDGAAPGRKPSRDHFYRRDPARALKGMSKLTLEERGAYSTLIDLTMLRGKPVEDDEHELAHEMRVDRRVWRRIRAALIAKGRIRAAGGLLIDDGCMETLHERAEARALATASGAAGGRKSARLRHAPGDDPPPASPYLEGEARQKQALRFPDRVTDPPEIKDLRQGGLNLVESEIEIESKDRIPCISASARDAPDAGSECDAVGLTLPEIQWACVSVAGPGLSNDIHRLAVSAGVLSDAIDRGCSLRLDLLPVIRAKTAEPRAEPITSWRYFDNAFEEARAVRLAAQGDSPIAAALESARRRHREWAAGRGAAVIGAAGTADEDAA